MNRRTRVDKIMVALVVAAALTSATPGFAAEKQPAREPASSLPAQTATVGAAADSSAKAQLIDPVTGMELLFVKGGCFQMGDEKGNNDEKPVHEVCVSDFYMGKYEVKQGEWIKVMGSNPSNKETCGGPDCPVGPLSWIMAQEFVNGLNDKGNTSYRLPTEAEWEYVAKSGGKQFRWSGTNAEKDLPAFARYSITSYTDKYARVGSLKPNDLGFYDLSGNMEEWCLDWFKENYYKSSPKNNPTGPVSGEHRVMRGGSANDAAYELRSSARDHNPPDAQEAGFRLVLPMR